MITLYISTNENVNTNDIISLLFPNKVECQVYENKSILKSITSECMDIENGFKICVFKVPTKDFKEKVWDPLQKTFDLQCGYVISDNDFIGCVYNWPEVFRSTLCPRNTLKHNTTSSPK
jgi:hypothetical protein